MNVDIPNDLIPNLMNVSREFINVVKEIMYDKYYPNFYFEFREEEAYIFIKQVITKFYGIDYYNSEYKEMLDDLKNKKYDNNKPVIVISNYKKFLTLLVNIQKEVVKDFIMKNPYKSTSFPRYEMINNLKNIWLRMTSLDFNNPLDFLKKEYLMLYDDSLSEYKNEKYLGSVSSLDNNILTVKRNISKSYNECCKEIQIRLYDKKCYNPDYPYNYAELPVIRYGIYTKNGKKICKIGSIQNVASYEYDFVKYINKERYKLNSNIDDEYIKKVEPKSVLSLSIFIDILNKEGIYDIEIPSMHVLDYEYHKKYYKYQLIKLMKDWDLESRKKYPINYKEDIDKLSKVYKKEDIISEIKTERFIKTIERIMIHHNVFKIKSYPLEVDDMFHIEFMPFSKDNIDNDILKEIYDLIDNNYRNKEIYK